MNRDIERYERDLNDNNYNNDNNMEENNDININNEIPSYQEVMNNNKTYNIENKKEKNEYDIDVIEFSENIDIKFEQKECLICIGEFEVGEKLSILKCNHCYHDLCLKDWIKKAKVIFCPLCQASRN